MSETKYRTICNIPDAEGKPCGCVIALTDGIKIPKGGEEPARKTLQFIDLINSHIKNKHPDVAKASERTDMFFVGFLRLARTISEDPNVQPFITEFAQYLQLLVCFPASDDFILGLVGKMEFTMDDPQRQKVIDGMRVLRDFILRRVKVELPQNLTPAA